MAVKLGLIGTGAIAQLHISEIRKYGEFDVVAGCDILPDRVEEFCRKWEIPRHYTGYNEMLDAESLDAVMVMTPNCAHCAPSVAALERDISVYCEKPMAMTVEEAEQMVAADRTSKATLTVGQQWRFSPQGQFIHKSQVAGDLGDVYFARTFVHRRGGVPWWGGFHRMEKSGGGALIDIGVHMIDLALWLMGSPQPVEVMGSTVAKIGPRVDGVRPNQDADLAHEFDVDDFASAYVRMDNGATMAVECSWAANRGPHQERNVEVYGDIGGATFEPLTVYTARHGQFVDLTPRHFEEIEAHGAATEYFRRIVLGEVERVVHPEETCNVQKVLAAIYQSSKERRALAL